MLACGRRWKCFWHCWSLPWMCAPALAKANLLTPTEWPWLLSAPRWEQKMHRRKSENLSFNLSLEHPATYPLQGKSNRERYVKIQDFRLWNRAVCWALFPPRAEAHLVINCLSSTGAKMSFKLVEWCLLSSHTDKVALAGYVYVLVCLTHALPRGANDAEEKQGPDDMLGWA